MRRLYGLIGFPLGHSFSARFFAEKFERERIENCSYQNFPLTQITELQELLLQNPNLFGLNVTIPYKEAVLPYLSILSPEAEAIGAVNCIKVTAQGLKGFNTDAYGFSRSLLRLIGTDRPPALVLGTGGASKAIKYVLEQLDIPYLVVSRSAKPGCTTYAALRGEVITEHPLLINTTPLGTFPNVEEAPELPYEAIGKGHFLFDLVYNPPLTKFLKRGQAQGAAIENGYEMLVGQAEKSWAIWNGSGE